MLSLRHFGLVLFIPWRVGAEEAGAANFGSMASAGALSFFVTPYTRAREVFLNSQCRRDAARPARAAWAVQRLLAARWRGRRRRRRRFGLSDFRFEAAAATRSATGSASPRPDRTSWLRGVALSFFVTPYTRAREVFLNLSAGAMLLDRLGPPGRCSGCWPHDGEVAGGAVADLV